ncbi:pilus assembly protein PilX [Salmonella enterica]|nr:pilus assembly protein PilX [Salmonella enterica]EJB7651128.1 pilus assembly protein PilX [Salmonella enterica]ELW8656399.1 pilus assembly protein PilX [Salmonella enterica]
MTENVISLNGTGNTGSSGHSPEPDRGWAMMEQGVVGLVIILVIVSVLGYAVTLWLRKDVASEATNIQTIITSTQGLLKDSDGYNFTSAAKMTGSLIQQGGVSRSMTIRGDVQAGTATLWNTWGGAVTLTPLNTAGFNNGFTLTYEKVPQAACVQIATRLSKSGVVDGITINATAHADGKVTSEQAGTQCTKDSGRTGTNKLIFTVNS